MECVQKHRGRNERQNSRVSLCLRVQNGLKEREADEETGVELMVPPKIHSTVAMTVKEKRHYAHMQCKCTRGENTEPAEVGFTC